jgi:hypothetical protein
MQLLFLKDAFGVLVDTTYIYVLKYVLTIKVKSLGPPSCKFSHL